MPTDEPQAAPAPSARSKTPDPRADAPKVHGDTGKLERADEEMGAFTHPASLDHRQAW